MFLWIDGIIVDRNGNIAFNPGNNFVVTCFILQLRNELSSGQKLE